MTPRVLHVVESMDRGAIENGLVRMLKHGRASGVELDWTFYCCLPGQGILEDQVRQLGARIIKTPVNLKQYFLFGRALRKEIATMNYDVLHSHHDFLSGLYLGAAAGLPLRQRIVQVHNAGEAVLTSNPVKQLIYKPLLRHTSLLLADRIVGVSDHTLDTFLEGRRRRPERDLVLYSGIEAGPFTGKSPDPRQFRLALGLSEDAVVLLFAGRMVAEKNPTFVIDVLLHLRSLDPRTVAVFAGSGPDEEKVLERAQSLGLADQVRVLGWRCDVPGILRCADLFIQPSPEEPMEGFGLAVVEAQLAGLRLLLSRGIADDPLLPNAAYRRLPLANGPQAWATAAAELMGSPAPSSAEAIAALAASPMDMDRALSNLLALHA